MDEEFHRMTPRAQIGFLKRRVRVLSEEYERMVQVRKADLLLEKRAFLTGYHMAKDTNLHDVAAWQKFKGYKEE